MQSLLSQVARRGPDSAPTAPGSSAMDYYVLSVVELAAVDRTEVIALAGFEPTQHARLLPHVHALAFDQPVGVDRPQDQRLILDEIPTVALDLVGSREAAADQQLPVVGVPEDPFGGHQVVLHQHGGDLELQPVLADRDRRLVERLDLVVSLGADRVRRTPDLVDRFRDQGLHQRGNVAADLLPHVPRHHLQVRALARVLLRVEPVGQQLPTPFRRGPELDDHRSPHSKPYGRNGPSRNSSVCPAPVHRLPSGAIVCTRDTYSLPIKPGASVPSYIRKSNGCREKSNSSHSTATPGPW